MTLDPLTRAASQLQAALHRLDIQPGHTTEAELEADDAAMRPALVDGQAPHRTPNPTATIENITASGAGKFVHNPTARFQNITAEGAGKILESTHP